LAVLKTGFFPDLMLDVLSHSSFEIRHFMFTFAPLPLRVFALKFPG